MKKVCISIAFLFFVSVLSLSGRRVHAQRLSRELHVDIRVNQVGYLPGASKICVVPGTRRGRFEVINLETQQVIYAGEFRPGSADLGEFSVGDFSAVRNEGHYYLRSDTLRSWPFAISRSVYFEPMDLIVQYFSRQRCGASTTGYLAPCHLDDGVRIDDGRYHDVTGGWHDASDLRKWVGATIYGVIGLAKALELQEETGNNRETILDELRWGNQYFLKMQEPEGFVMSFVGGDVRKHSDSNRWTDNEVGAKGGELNMVKPTTGRSSADMLIFGGKDDRVIETKPLDIIGQFNFITAEALMARITKDVDGPYSQRCVQAAKKCFDWTTRTNKDASTGVVGAALQAAIEMFRTTGEEKYKEFAVAQAERLKSLQAKAQSDGVGGFFYTSSEKQEPHKDIWHGCQHFISMCDLLELFPSHSDGPEWRRLIAGYSQNYLMQMSQRNSFGIVPYGLFAGNDPGGNRRVGPYWYRYFMQPDPTWWVGINSNLASAGVGLMKAGRVLGDRKLEAVAQRQLDWIVGVNPFSSSTVVGVGHNHPKHFPGSTFFPLTPIIPGAVLNGLGGNASDQAIIGDGHWQISEYWTPMVSYTLWLMAELSRH